MTLQRKITLKQYSENEFSTPQDHEVTEALPSHFQEAAAKERNRKLRTICIVLAVIMGVGALLLGMLTGYGIAKGLATAVEDSSRKTLVADPSAEREKLQANWSSAQGSQAVSVNFDLKLQSSDSEQSMSFNNDGKVTAADNCYTAESSYIVLTDGSLAVENLSEAVSKEGCSESEVPSLFWTSKLSFENEAWTAYSADSEKLVEGLKEQ